MKWFIIISIFCTSTAFAVDFTYTRATEYTDNTPLPVENIRSTRMYCDGDDVTWVAGEPGADETITANLRDGVHTCYVAHTAINLNGDVYQGNRSNVVIVGEPVELVIGSPTNLAVVE